MSLVVLIVEARYWYCKVISKG